MVAEIAAGVILAEEVVSTSVQGAAATYAVAKPTMPLKAVFGRIATAKDDKTELSLARSNHTVTVIGNRAYIFGGETASGQIASNEIHSIILSETDKPESDYSLTIAIADDEENGEVPVGRTRHAACAFNVCVAVFGGSDESGKLVDSDAIIWLYNTAKSSWERLRAESSNIAPTQRSDAKLFNYKNNLILYGGFDAEGHALKDVWHFNYVTKEWKPLPSAPVSTTNAALAGRSLHLISASDTMSSDLHSLDLSDLDSLEWNTISFPTNPLAPGPRPRIAGGLIPISTGYGRNYLLYFFGARQNPTTSETKSPDETTDPTQWGDIWTYQLPSEQPEVKPTLSIAEAVKPARIKDAIRSTLGFDSGTHSWAEVEVLPPTNLDDGDGKLHPGPRGYFGCDVMEDGHSVVFWGGINARGDKEGDGWVIRLS